MKNRYGLDSSYFKGKLELILRDLENYKPDEIARELARLSVTADDNVIKEDEFKSQWVSVKDGFPDPLRDIKVHPYWYDSYDNEVQAHYCDVRKIFYVMLDDGYEMYDQEHDHVKVWRYDD